MMLFASSNATINLALHCQCHLDCHGSHEIEDESSGGSIDVSCGNTLAGGAPAPRFIGTDVSRPRGAGRIAVVAHIHRAATPPTHHPPLQQRWTFTRRAERIRSTEGL